MAARLVSEPAPWALAALQNAQKRPSFFDQRSASKDYDGCDGADGFEGMRVALLEEPPGAGIEGSQLFLSRQAMRRR
jgi:hypothetical protein